MASAATPAVDARSRMARRALGVALVASTTTTRPAARRVVELAMQDLERHRRGGLIRGVARDVLAQGIGREHGVGREVASREGRLAGAGRADQHDDAGLGDPGRRPRRDDDASDASVGSPVAHPVVMDAPSRMRAPAVMWFRRDLRLRDHPALTDALGRHDAVVPLFVLDPRLLRGRFASPNRTWFLLGSLRVARRGASRARRAAPRACRRPADGRAGDRPRGRRVRTCTSRAIRRRTGGRGTAWSPRRWPHGGVALPPEARRPRPRAGRGADPGGRLVRGVLAVPAGVGGALAPSRPARSGRGVDASRGPARGRGAADRWPISDSATDPRPTSIDLPEPGELAARRRLERWLEGGIDRYDATRDRLDDEAGTSRLSPDLHLGTLSPLEVVERVAGSGEGRRRFLAELVWREFYAHVLFHRPERTSRVVPCGVRRAALV